MKYLILFIATLILFISCSDPKIDYLEEFGYFINDIELRQDAIDDKSWKSVEAKYTNYSERLIMKYENELTEREINQINSFRERFKKLRVKRDPSGSWLEILGIGKD